MSQALPVEQAEKCLCPFVGVTSSGLCRTDKCMAWAWAQEPHLFAKIRLPGIEDKAPSVEAFPLPGEDGWAYADGPRWSFFNQDWFVNFRRDSDPERPGFCGMIHQPGGSE